MGGDYITEIAGNSKTPKTKKSIAAKEKIYHTSINMIPQKGFQETKIKVICREANVSAGTFNSCFDTKEDVIKEMYLTADNFFFKNAAKEIENIDCIHKIGNNTLPFYIGIVNNQSMNDIKISNIRCICYSLLKSQITPRIPGLVHIRSVPG